VTRRDLFAWASGAYDAPAEYGDILRRSDGWVARPTMHDDCADLVERLHYSGGCARVSSLACGLFDPRGLLVGAALWMPPAPGASTWVSTRTGCGYAGVIGLSRLAIEDAVPRNAASFLLAESVRHLRVRALQVAVTFADGAQGHDGGVYRASNWLPAGAGEPRERWFDRQGRQRSAKATVNLTVADMLGRGWTKKPGHPKPRFLLAIQKRFRRAVAVAATAEQRMTGGGAR